MMYYPPITDADLLSLMPRLPPKMRCRWLEHSRYDAIPILAAMANLKSGDLFLKIPHVGQFHISNRCKVFANHSCCMICGLEARIFIVERLQHEVKWQLKLYGIKDRYLVRLTMDHRLPKALGGGNESTNLQTMCHYCNMNKADRILDPFLAAKMRK